MTTLPLRRWLAAIFMASLATVLSAAEPAAPKVENLGNNTYRVSASATHKFTRNTEKLKAEATAAASAFCAAQGKQLKIVKVDESKSFYGVGDMAKATVTFKALDLSDPELAGSAVAAPSGSPTPSAAPAAPLTNEALYADLLRLDDLRKKGILTEEEFAAEKKKVLERSK
jgi:hypothetical protein